MNRKPPASSEIMRKREKYRRYRLKNRDKILARLHAARAIDKYNERGQRTEYRKRYAAMLLEVRTLLNRVSGLRAAPTVRLRSRCKAMALRLPIKEPR